MRLTQLRAFVAIARAGGVGAAAKQLHVSQPALSIQVHQLEARYGVELFVRVGRGLRLTETGQRLLALAAPLATIEADVVHLLTDVGGMKGGVLRLGAVSPYHVTQILAEFGRRYPQMKVQVRFGNSDAVLRELLDARVDVGVLAHAAHDPRLLGMPYRRDPIVALVSREHEWASRKRIRIADLDGQRMVVREQGSTARTIVEAALASAGAKPVVAMELGSREALREAVAAGIGIGTVSEAAVPSDPRLRMLRFSDGRMELVTHLFCLQSRREAQVIRSFLAVAQSLGGEEAGRKTRPRAPVNAGRARRSGQA
ncbi:MAG: LysR family transcriptional regulator [Proteobacteria bacterium]|nr:LysR family transcriptional regulator [Pseudomonadota bacterium]